MENRQVVLANGDHQLHAVQLSRVIDLQTPAALTFRCSRVCHFSSNQDDVQLLTESIERSKVAKKLSGLIALYFVFMAVEVFGGLKSNSLAILTDAAHLLSDVAGVSISLISLWASTWQATPRQSFGYNRLEVLGALASVQLIWLISSLLIYEAITRIVHQKAKVNGGLMLGIAAFGFLINLIMATWLGHNHGHHHHGGGNNHKHHDHEKDHHHHGGDHDKSCEKTIGIAQGEEEARLVPKGGPPLKGSNSNINLQGAYLHVIADLIQSVGVMIAGAIIWLKPDWLIVDLMCTIVFSAFALSATVTMLRSIFGILMETTPDEIDVTRLEDDLKAIDGVVDIHDLHVWALTPGKNVISCHVRADPTRIGHHHELLATIRNCVNTYRFHHVTIQME